MILDVVKQRNKRSITITEFAGVINNMLRSDRDVLLATAGFTGEGKTTFVYVLMKEYSRLAGVPFGFNNFTWSRKELMTWIDGEPNTEKGANGLKPGQLPEYSGVVPDELFRMFYRRTWYETGQIDGIATFNMCRDRHLFIAGNIPNFWDLDGSFTSRVRFYVYIPKRGFAWVFQQENNPFAKDYWNINKNYLLCNKEKAPYNSPNFLFEIRYPDMSPEEKEEYLNIRNEKRLQAITNVKEKDETHRDLKKKLKDLILLFYEHNPKLPNRIVADAIGMSNTGVRDIREGLSLKKL